MAQPPNLYSYLATYSSPTGAITGNPSNDPTIQNLNGLPVGKDNVRGDILVFPPGLAGQPLPAAGTSGSASIPFTLFMPYLRAGFHSIGKFYDTLPTPTFAIALPTPTSALKTDYSVQYSPFDVGQAIGAVSQNVSEAWKAFKIGDKDTALLKSAAVLGNTAKVAGTDIVKELMGNSKESISILMGQQENPFTENVFKNVDFRSHEFTYTFMPKNITESKTIDRIINIFKFAMLPEPGTAGFLNFPYEFQITHSIQSTTFTLLPSVLESFSVDYGGGADSPKLFNPTAGQQYPAKITISMKFKEMVLLTRDKILVDVPGIPASPTYSGWDGGLLLRFRF